MMMFQIKKYIKYFASVILLSSLASCSEHDGISNDDEVPDGMQRVSFCIPDYAKEGNHFGTRAYNTEEEGYMSNLYVIAIKYTSISKENGIEKEEIITNEAGDPTPILYTYALNPVGVDFKVGDEDWKVFNIPLYPGRYKFAVVANLDLYLWRTKKISDFTSEDDLKNIVLYFSEDVPIAPPHLPMACLPNEIKYSQPDENGAYGDITPVKENIEVGGKFAGDYLVTIRENGDKDYSTRIYADMKFQCAKVRYTILFDKTPGGISELFGNTWIRFNVDDNKKPLATNLRAWTMLENGEISKVEPSVSRYIMKSSATRAGSTEYDGTTGASQLETMGWWNMDIDRFYWPGPDEDGKIHGADEGKDYPLKPSSKLEAWTGSTRNWIPKKKKAWQGVVYLPENLPDESLESGKDIRTLLRFPYYTRENDLDETPEVPADEDKHIYLFGNPNEEKFGGLGKDDEYKKDNAQFDGIARNVMYDVVAKVVNPDIEGMKIQVFVSIIDWHESNQEILPDDLDNPKNPSGSADAGETDPETKINQWEREGNSSTW